MEISIINSKLPQAHLGHIFSFLSISDQKVVAVVCKYWNQAGHDEGLWRRLIQREWTLLPLPRVREHLKLTPEASARDIYQEILIHLEAMSQFVTNDKESQEILTSEKNPAEAVLLFGIVSAGLEKRVPDLQSKVSSEVLQYVFNEACVRAHIEIVEILQTHPNITVSRRLVLYTDLYKGDVVRLKSFWNLLPKEQGHTDNITSLIDEAVRAGKSEVLENLLQTKRELFADESFRLHHAIWANKGALVEQLLENKDLDPNAKDHHGMTPLHWAVILQRKEIAQSLIKCEKVKPETTDRLGETPFVYAYRLKSFSKQGVLFDWLVQEQGFDHNPLVYFHSLKESLRLLHSVAIANEIEIIEQLLCNEDINPNVVDSSYGTPLHCAAACGNIEAVIALLKCPRTQPDIKHSSQGTPLHIAAFYNRAEVIKELLALPGVDPNARHLSGKTPLHYAVMGKSAEAIDALLNNPRLDPDLLSPAGFTALQLAHKESMKVLLDHPRINPNQRNQHGQTVLHYAIDRNAIEEAKILINHSRVDPNLPPHRWFYPTPFEVAKRDGRSEIAELLRPKTYFLDRYISRRAQVSALGGLAGGLLGLMLAHSINRLYRSWSAIKQLSHHRWRNLTP